MRYEHPVTLCDTTTLVHVTTTDDALTLAAFSFVISKCSASFLLCENCSDVPPHNSTRTTYEQGQQVCNVKRECLDTLGFEGNTSHRQLLFCQTVVGYLFMYPQAISVFQSAHRYGKVS